jgi:hypothetical protein
MGFYCTNTFTLGAVAFRERGTGSSNCLLTLAVYDVTNTFFSSTNVNKWPRNFQPNLDSDPKGMPIFKTNLDFYLTAANAANGPGGGTNDQILMLSIAPPYQLVLSNNHQYVVELSADTVGQNSGSAGLFQWIRSTNQSTFEIELFPSTDQFDTGYRTNGFSSAEVYVLPRALSCTYSDPENARGTVTSDTTFGRDMVMALYQPIVGSIQISNIVHRANGNVEITWGALPMATYSVLRTNTLKAYSTNYGVVVVPPIAGATGLGGSLTGGPLSYTDTTATASMNFYQITSP